MSKSEDELRARITQIENQINPPPRQPSTFPRFDPTEGMTMPANAVQAMIDAVPASVMRGLVNDAFKPNPVTGGSHPQPTNQVQRGSGWRDEVPLGPPPGNAHVDRIVRAQDRLDKAERAYAIAKAEALMKGK
jgi:hypothetical protein